jgi:phenylacetaldehyde dehydrogenase
MGRGQSGKTFEVEDPATQEIIAHVPAGDKADINLAVKAARKALETGPWSRISPADRAKLIWRLGDLLEKHADEFAEIEALDNGKPVKQSGWGREMGKEVMEHYTETKSVAINRG